MYRSESLYEGTKQAFWAEPETVVEWFIKKDREKIWDEDEFGEENKEEEQ